jgi:hypothetical protein
MSEKEPEAPKPGTRIIKAEELGPAVVVTPELLKQIHRKRGVRTVPQA